MKTTLATSAALTALLFGAVPVAQAQTAAPGPAPGSTFQRSETPGRPAVPGASDVDYSRAMERLFQSAQRLRESIQAMAQQPPGERRNQAMAQAREALLATQQAMVQLPPDLRTTQNYRDAEQRVGEARQVIESPQPDAQRAQVAVDAYLVLVPRLQADAAARSGTTTGAPTAGAAPAAGGGATPAAVAAGVPLQRMSNLPGTDLIGTNGETVGEIENLLVDRNGSVRAVVVEWGGFLGIGERERLVPVDRVQLGTGGDDRARISMTREQIEALPRFDRSRLADYSRDYGWGEGTRWYR